MIFYSYRRAIAMERVKYLQNNDLFSGYSNFCFQFIFGIETKIASSARMCSGSGYTSSCQGYYLLYYARPMTLNREIQRDGLSLLIFCMK